MSDRRKQQWPMQGGGYCPFNPTPVKVATYFLLFITNIGLVGAAEEESDGRSQLSSDDAAAEKQVRGGGEGERKKRELLMSADC